MKNAKINSKNLVATSIAAAILAITGSTPVIGNNNVAGATTPASNRVNNGELIIAQCYPFPPFCWWNNDNQGNPEQEEIVDREKGRAVAHDPSKKHSLV
jgi:hypothetical protein